MKKRIISVITAVAMLVTSVSVSNVKRAAAESSGDEITAAYCWNFDDLSGDTLSNSGTEKEGNAILKGNASVAEDVITVGETNYKTSGNKVLVLSGGTKGSSYVELPSDIYKGITAETGFSYSFWLKPDESVGSYSRAVSSANENSGNEFAIAPYASDKVWNVLFDDTDIVRAPMTTEPTKNQWSFMTFTISSEKIVYYINGEEVGSYSDSSNLKKRLASMESLVKNALGMTCSGWSDPDAKVQLDDVCLYKTALTKKQVVSLAKEQGIEVAEKTEFGGANELTDGTAVTDTEISVSKGNVSVKVVTDEKTGRYFITASRNGDVVLDASQLGITTSADLTKNLSYVNGSLKSSSGTDEYTLTTGAKREVKEDYNEISFQLKPQDSETALTVIVRVYESGMAYRYELTGTAGKTAKIKGEASEYVLPADSYIWAGYDTAGNYEYEYQKIKISAVKNANATYSVPLLTNSGNNWMLFTEADVFSREDTYCASDLKTSAGTRNLKYEFGKGSGSSITMTYDEKGMIQTPWRVAVVADNLNDIINSTMTSSLNPAADETLYKDSDSWIKTGTVAWSWWSEAGDDPIEFDQQKDYIDFAAENGWEYVCLDFGWCLWDDYKNKVKELVDYGEQKGVGILLWYGVNNDNHAGSKDAQGDAAYPKYSLQTKDQFEEQFAWCESVGVKGVKVDYYENDDKNTMTQMYQCVTIAAKHKINVLFHGCTAPRGEIRTFPNILGYEAVRGSEYYKWNIGPSVSNCLTYVYNRNVVGGMDFTPVGTQIDQLDVTAGFQLAQVIAYQTGLQNIASSVYKLEGYQGLSMINDVPAQWDETRLLDGYPGEDITIARRNQEDWYIAAMTADSKTETISLDFLGEGDYRAYIYKDNADGTDVVIEEKDVTKDSTLSLLLAENSGAAIKITKETMKTSTIYDNYTFYEAEDTGNSFSGTATIGTNQFASGMKQVTGIGGTAYNKLTIQSVTAPEDGIYEMRLYYACGVDRRVVYCVNNGDEIRSGKLNAGVNTLAMETFYVRLQKGENSITFGNTLSKAPNIDRIAISKSTVEETETVTDLTDDGETAVDGTQYDYTIYGADTAALAGGAIIENGAVGWLGGSAASIATFPVKVSEAGKYKLQINYFTGETRNVTVKVNGKAADSYSCPSTGSYTIDSADSIYVEVELKKGTNTIQLGNSSGWCPNISSIGVSKTVLAVDSNTTNVTEKDTTNNTSASQKSVQKVVITKKGSSKAITKTVTLKRRKKLQLLAKVTVTGGASKKVTWKSSNKKIAAVSSNGVVTAKAKKGKVKITAVSKADKKKKYTITIKVK